MKRFVGLTLIIIAAIAANAQNDSGYGRFEALQYGIEFQASVSSDKTPLWLNANKYGLSSLDKTNGYFRAMAGRPIEADSSRHWGVGYKLDVAKVYNYTSDFVVQQAYAEARWYKTTLAVGSKQYPMELKNQELSSGSQTFGVNARPIPQVRVAVADYWTLPLTKKQVHIKGHIAYGRMTDDNWQHEFTHKTNKYSDDVILHSKAGYMKIGKAGKPFSVELGLEMASQFGGSTYFFDKEGNVIVFKNSTNFNAYLNAFLPGGKDVNEITYRNIEGNQLGSWLARISYDKDNWRVSVYADKYFEDHSAMFLLDYDGYGTGDEWDKRKECRFFLYDFKDMMLGAELNLKNGNWLRDIVFEYISTRYQSGPIYHDHTQSINDHIGGIDNYYNHGIYPGWQHWGQVIGNPLYRSPIYNDDGMISVKSNRFKAVHLGISGNPLNNVRYRLLGTYQESFGTYYMPYIKKQHNVSILAEAEYRIKCDNNGLWNIRGGCGFDSGDILGNNYGFQLTLSHSGLIKTRKAKKER